MVLSKRKYKPKCFPYGGEPLQAAKCFNYLGFVVSYNGKFRNLIQDRVLKATRMANMILQTIKTNKNVSVKLAISLFDKQISPILLYGCPIWSPPQWQNLIYVVNQPEETNNREIIIRTTTEKRGRRIPFDYDRRIGRKTQHKNRRILIRLTDYDDKEELLRYVDNSPCLFENFLSKNEYPYERVHTSFMK